MRPIYNWFHWLFIFVTRVDIECCAETASLAQPFHLSLYNIPRYIRSSPSSPRLWPKIVLDLSFKIVGSRYSLFPCNVFNVCFREKERKRVITRCALSRIVSNLINIWKILKRSWMIQECQLFEIDMDENDNFYIK